MTPRCGSKKVATVGTPESIVSSSLRLAWVEIYAPDTNTSVLYVGDSNVRAVLGGEAGGPLEPGKRYFLRDVDLYEWWVDVRTANDKVTWIGSPT